MLQNSKLWPIAILTIVVSANQVAVAQPGETPHIVFVREYIRELGKQASVRSMAEAELAEKDGHALANLIHISTNYQLALRADTSILAGMRLDPPFETLVGNISDFDKQKIEVHERLIEIATEMMSGPKPGVDYGKMAAEVPKLRAVLENIDASFMTLSVLVFGSLIDSKPDKDNHMSRLVITKSERQELLGSLHTWFGAKMDKKDQTNIVSAATVLRDYLRKGYTCSDEVSQ